MHEQRVYEALAGQIEIDSQGRIWRIGQLSNSGDGSVIPVERRRAEGRARGYLTVRAWIDSKHIVAAASRVVWHHLHGPIPEGQAIATPS